MNQQQIMKKNTINIKYPLDWKVQLLGEIGEFVKGKGISKQEIKVTGIPCILYGEIYTDHHVWVKKFKSFIDQKTALKSMRIKKGDLLCTGSGETKEEIGKAVAFLGDDEAYAGGDIIILRPNKSVNSLYLSYALNSEELIKERARLGQGHSVVHIYPKELKSIKIHLPSLPEQHKIASILSTWDKAIELKEKLIEQKKEQKKGLMQKLLTGEVRLPGFDGEWRKVYLKDVTVGKGTYGLNAPSVEKSSQYPTYLRITDISDDGYLHTNSLQSVNHSDSSNYYLEENDIVFARTGASTGRSYLYDKSDGKLVFAGFLIRFKIDTSKAVPKFIKYCTQTEKYKNWVKIMSMRSGQPGINAEEYGKLPIFLPSIEEQLTISKILSKLDQETLLVVSELELLKQQKKGLMQLLLTGKVRVKV